MKILVACVRVSYSRMNEAGATLDVSCKYNDVVPTLEWPIADETAVKAAPPLREKVAKQWRNE